MSNLLFAQVRETLGREEPKAHLMGNLSLYSVLEPNSH